MPNLAVAEVVYPPGCKEVGEDLSADDLVRRLNQISLAFQQMSQDDDNSAYLPLAVYLINDFFLDHPSKDVRLLVACSVADVFRVYAPRSPYETPDVIKRIFLFFIHQLKGLQDPKETNFKRHFYLLENLAWVKSFNLCFELEDSQEIFCELFQQIFNIIGDNHSEKVKGLMSDMLSPLIAESDIVSNNLLKIVLNQIIEPRRTANRCACILASGILEKTATVIEPYLNSYFTNILDRAIGVEEGDSDNEVEEAKPIALTSRNAKKKVTKKESKCASICEMIYELYRINPELIQGVFHLVEAKLKDNDDAERREFTKLVARLFSDRNSKLYETHPEMWKQFLGRFRDIAPLIRCRCVQYSMHFLINHPEMKADITEQLRQRQHDKDETVRYEVVLSIISAGKKGIKNINEELLSFVKERALDARFKIRREALLGMAQLYKQYIFASNDQNLNEIVTDEAQKTLSLLSWVKNKCMMNYFQQNLEDKLLVERILITCLVPFQLPIKERMKALYMFYCSLDNNAAKAFNELLKQQQSVRRLMKDVMDVVNNPEETEEHRALLKSKILLVAKNLTEPVKAEEFITRLVNNLENNETIRNQMNSIITSAVYIQVDSNGKCVTPPTSSAIENATKDILKSLGFPVQTNSYYMIIKQLMERISPIMIDHDGLLEIFNYVSDSLIGDGEQDNKMGLRGSAKRGLELILILSQIFPAIFYGREIFNMYLLPFLWQCQDNHQVAEIVMQILTHIGNSSAPDSETCLVNSSIVWWAETEEFINRLTDKYILNANTTRQAKYAVRCLNNIIHEDNKRMQVFADIIDKIKAQKMSLESTPNMRFHLVALGQIAINGGHAYFPKIIRSIIQKFIVQGLLLKDTRTDLEIETLQEQELSRDTLDHRGLYEHLSLEVKTKIEGIKLLVRWIQGLKLNTLFLNEEKFSEANAAYTTAAQNTFRLLKTIIQNDGDVNGKGLAGTIYERAYLRLHAGLAMLKISSFDALTNINSNNEHVFGRFAVTLDIMHPSQWHTLAQCLLDAQHFVRERFLLKLHKGLISLNLTLEFLAYFALGGVMEDGVFKKKMKQFMIVNINKRREVVKSRGTSNAKAVMPDCVLPYVVHLLANMPFYPIYSSTRTPELDKVQACMWFILEPLVMQNEQFSFSFFKRNFDNIKLCVDRCGQALLKNDPKAEEQVNNTNLKIYCICDIGLGLVMSKTQNFLSKEFPIEPSLPGKYYTALPPQGNMYRSYLPQDMSFAVPKRCELEAEVLGKVTKGFSQARVKSPKIMRASTKTENDSDQVLEEVVIAEGMVQDDQQGQLSQEEQQQQDQQAIKFDGNEVEQLSDDINNAQSGEENGSDQQQPPQPAQQQPTAGRKRGRPRADSETLSPTKATKAAAAAPVSAAEPPARKSSRLSTRKVSTPNYDEDDEENHDSEEVIEEEIVTAAQNAERGKPVARRGRGRPKKN